MLSSIAGVCLSCARIGCLAVRLQSENLPSPFEDCTVPARLWAILAKQELVMLNPSTRIPVLLVLDLLTLSFCSLLHNPRITADQFVANRKSPCVSSKNTSNHWVVPQSRPDNQNLEVVPFGQTKNSIRDFLISREDRILNWLFYSALAVWSLQQCDFRHVNTTSTPVFEALTNALRW